LTLNDDLDLDADVVGSLGINKPFRMIREGKLARFNTAGNPALVTARGDMLKGTGTLLELTAGESRFSLK